MENKALILEEKCSPVKCVKERGSSVQIKLEDGTFRYAKKVFVSTGGMFFDKKL